MAVGRSTAVGGFVLGALLLAVIAILLFTGANWFRSKVRMVAYFQNSVAGLAVGAPVTLRGVKIGTVESMKVYLKLPDLVPVIPVYIQIDPGQVSWTSGSHTGSESDLDLAVKSGLRAQLVTQSVVTGQLAVNLDFYPETPAVVSGNSDVVPEIPTIPSDLQRIKDEIADLKLPELAEKARIALTGINQIVGELHGKVGPLMDSLRQTSDDARGTLDTTSGAVQQLQRDASRTLDAVNKLSNTTEVQVLATGKDLGRVAASVDRVAAQAEKVAANLDAMTSPRSPLRGSLEAAARDLAASASSLRNFSRDVERNPNVILLGRTPR